MVFSGKLHRESYFQIHFDGWPHEYDLWYEDDSSLLQPAGWAEKTGHPLLPPLSKKSRFFNLSNCNVGFLQLPKK